MPMASGVSGEGEIQEASTMPGTSQTKNSQNWVATLNEQTLTLKVNRRKKHGYN